MPRIKNKAPFLLQDRVLVAALCFGSSGYIVMQSWEGIALLVAGFITAAVWAFRTAGSHPLRGMRLAALMLLVTLGAFMTVYIAAREGIIR